MTEVKIQSKGPKYEIIVDDNTQPSISKGNHKIGKGIYSFSLLPGDDPLSINDGELLTSIPGTCTGICGDCKKYCYAVRDAKLHHNVTIPAWGKNTLLMRWNMKKLMDKLDNFIKTNNVKLWRWQVAGEIESYEYLEAMNDIAEKNPKVKFGVYTKRFDFVEKFLAEHENKFASNLCVNISEWNHNTDGYKLNGLNRFIWDDGDDEEVSKLPHCPAVSKPKAGCMKGHRTTVTCDHCGRCYNTTGQKTAVYNH